VFATQVAQARGNTSGRILRAASLPLRVVVPAFLPLPEGTYSVPQRTFTPSPEPWTALARAGADLARVTFTGPRSRHVVLLPLLEGQVPLRLPDSPPGVGEDPVTQELATGELVALDLSVGITREDALDLTGANLTGLPLILDAYSRARSW
jgi:DNA-binding transcriptional LysR family regulator